LANWYEVRASAKPGERNQAFRYRTGQWMAAQKVGKSPGVAAETCFEFVGPSLFDGFAADGDYYSCAEHGCPCGWVYFYEVGEPMGRPWPTPRIQLAAVVEDQVENTWGALVPMIDNGPLANVIPKTGEAFIRHPSHNRDSRVEIVTSKADGKLGARISAGKCDETGLWTDHNSMKKFMRTLRRGAGGMGGRVSESTNPFDPAENSQAQETFESPSKDILKHYYPPATSLKFDLKRDREVIFRWNYASSPWVDQRSIEAEAAALLEKNPLRRNGSSATGSSPAPAIGSPTTHGVRNVHPITVEPRTAVCLGFDGSDNNDWTGIRLETTDFYQFTPTYQAGTRSAQRCGSPTRRTTCGSRAWKSLQPLTRSRTSTGSCAPTATRTCGSRRSTPGRPSTASRCSSSGRRQSIGRMHAALERFLTDITNPDSQFRHDDDPETALNFRNAIIRSRPGQKYILGKPSDHQKIDMVMSSALAHEATWDAFAAGDFTEPTDNRMFVFR
jgi:hypothetical protein